MKELSNKNTLLIVLKKIILSSFIIFDIFFSYLLLPKQIITQELKKIKKKFKKKGIFLLRNLIKLFYEEVEVMQRIVIKSYETKKSIVMPIILLIIGVILFANPGGVMDFISYILGGAFLGLGIWKLLSDYKRENKTTGDMFYSILLIIVGILFIFTGTLDVLIRIILGFWLIINGVNTLAVGANLMKINSKNIVSLIIGFILIIMGIYTILVSNLVLSALGLILTIYSILEIINCIYISIKNK